MKNYLMTAAFLALAAALCVPVGAMPAWATDTPTVEQSQDEPTLGEDGRPVDLKTGRPLDAPGTDE